MKKSAFLTMLLLVTVMLTGCFCDFGPAKASTPEIVLISESPLALHEPLSFSIENWNRELEYKVEVDGKELKATTDGSTFTVSPEPEWELLNTLTVTVTDQFGDTASASKEFKAIAKNKISVSKSGSDVTFTPMLEKIENPGDITIVWDITFRIKDSSSTTGYKDETETYTKKGNEALTAKVPADSYPEVRYVAMLSDNKVEKETIERTYHFPVNITADFANDVSIPDEAGMQQVDVSGTCDHDVDLFKWSIGINKGTIGAKMTNHYGTTIKLSASVDAKTLDRHNIYWIEASYKSLDGASRTIKSDPDDFFY